MARPRKPDGERLISVSTSLSPEDYDRIDAIARRFDVPVAELLRKTISRELDKSFKRWFDEETDRIINGNGGPTPRGLINWKTPNPSPAA